MVSNGAGNREGISLMASYVSRQCAGAGWGFSRACLIALGFFGDAADSDDGVCAGGRLATLPLPLLVGALVPSPGNSYHLHRRMLALGVDDFDLDTLWAAHWRCQWSESGTGVGIGQAVVVLELEESNGRVRCSLLRNKTRRSRGRTAPSFHECKE